MHYCCMVSRHDESYCIGIHMLVMAAVAAMHDALCYPYLVDRIQNACPALLTDLEWSIFTCSTSRVLLRDYHEMLHRRAALSTTYLYLHDNIALACFCMLSTCVEPCYVVRVLGCGHIRRSLVHGMVVVPVAGELCMWISCHQYFRCELQNWQSSKLPCFLHMSFTHFVVPALSGSSPAP